MRPNGAQPAKNNKQYINDRAKSRLTPPSFEIQSALFIHDIKSFDLIVYFF